MDIDVLIEPQAADATNAPVSSPWSPLERKALLIGVLFFDDDLEQIIRIVESKSVRSLFHISAEGDGQRGVSAARDSAPPSPLRERRFRRSPSSIALARV